ncbi:MAG: DUF4175 family protein [Candidatus Cyclobacteriaceae bacterium M3_2C_046]
MNGELKSKLEAYKRKFYKNLIIRGSLISLSIILVYYLLFNLLEYSVRFNSTFRGIIFFSFLVLAGVLLVKWIVDPLSRILIKHRQISNEQAAKNIGGYFPIVRDKLLNVLQLESLADNNNDLIKASIAQKSKEISGAAFSEAIDYHENLRYLKYALPVFLIAILSYVSLPHIFQESTTRIVNYKKEFIPQAPFSFVILNDNLRAFKSEDFTIKLGFEGSVIPQHVYLNTEGRRIKLQSGKQGSFEYTFNKVQHDENFSFEAGGFNSASYELEVVNRPNIKNFNVFLSYPAYLNKENERLSNIGNFAIPEGTEVQWQFSTIESDSVSMVFEEENQEYVLQKTDNQIFEHDKVIESSDNYLVKLKNRYSQNKDLIRYHIDVIPDKHPVINLDQFRDTTFYNYMILGGNISDDYGLHDLNLFFKVLDENQDDQDNYQALAIPIDRQKTSQSYYYQWRLDSFNLKQGDRIEYFLQVRDNDGINGRKSSRTSLYTFKVPTKKELKESLDQSAENSRKQIDKSIQQAQELNEQIEETVDRLKGKKEMNWQDEKMIQDLLKQKEELNKAIEELKENYENDAQKRERFDQEKNQRIQEKAEQLQELMNELLDEETRKLYEELQKLLDEKKEMDEVQDLLEKINNNEQNLEKELERTLELFKQMKFDYKLEEVIEQVDELSKEQEELSEQTKDKQSDLDEIKNEQENLDQEYKEVEEDLEELHEINQDLKSPKPMDNLSQEQEQIKQEQQNTKDALEKGKRKQAEKSQKNSSQKMKQMSQKLQQMQSNMEMTMMQENLDNLREIEDNLIKLSFNQEDLMQNFRKVNQSDPRFIDLSQQQLKIKDDAKIIEDSLRSLAERVFQIRSFVTREVDEMNDHLDGTVDALKERKKNIAVGKQQFAMTSMNNLALLLNDVLQQMQQQMADAMGMPSKNQKKGNQPLPNLSELQKQLNDKINQLKKSGKTGRQLSEELAKLAAEQEQLRKMMQQQEDQAEQKGNKGKGSMGDIADKMEETEIDLVNKQLTQRTIERQQEILTRMLEAEEAMRERELDEKREGETAKEQERKIPPAFEEYIKLKEQEIELLKTVPPKMNPYYKNEVSEYFKRLKN